MTAMPAAVVPQPGGWRGATLARDEYLVPIPEACRHELRRVRDELRAAPVPTLLLLPEHFELTACARWMTGVRDRLDQGPGFVILDRLDVDDLTRQEAVDIYWVLANLLEPPVAQEWKGTVIYDVRHDAGCRRRRVRAPHGRVPR